jgi:hypothetical protein
MKKIKDGSLYYHQKDIMRPVGAVMLPVGLVLLYLGWGLISYILTCICVPVGLVLFIVGSSKNISDNDLQAQIDHALRDYDRALTETKGFDRAVLRQPAPMEITAYSFGDDATYFKKAKNGTPRSDRLTRIRVFFTKEGILLAGRTLSIAALNEATGEGMTDFTASFAFSEITSAELEVHETPVTMTNSGKTSTVKWCELVLRGEADELLRVPVQNDMDAASLCEILNR